MVTLYSQILEFASVTFTFRKVESNTPHTGTRSITNSKLIIKLCPISIEVNTTDTSPVDVCTRSIM